MLLGVHDWLLQNNLVSVEGRYPSVYVGTGLFLIFMFIMLRRCLRALGSERQAKPIPAWRSACRRGRLNSIPAMPACAKSSTGRP